MNYPKLAVNSFPYYCRLILTNLKVNTMGVDTKVHIPIINRDVQKTVKAVQKCIKNKMPLFGEIDAEITHMPLKNEEFKAFEMWRLSFALDYHCNQFESKKEQRRISLYYDHHVGGEMISLSFSCWGHNEDIAKCIVDSFGGYADFNDCDDIVIDYAMPQPKKLTQCPNLKN